MEEIFLKRLLTYNLRSTNTFLFPAVHTVNYGTATIRYRGEWPSGLYSLRQVTEVKLGRVRSDFGWVTTEA